MQHRAVAADGEDVVAPATHTSFSDAPVGEGMVQPMLDAGCAGKACHSVEAPCSLHATPAPDSQER
jgi:hypothetical protein